MILRYIVHRASPHPFPVEAKLARTDESVQATVQSVEVELVPENHDGGSILMRFVGAAASEAAKRYHQGDIVEMDEAAFKVTSPEAAA